MLDEAQSSARRKMEMMKDTDMSRDEILGSTDMSHAALLASSFSRHMCMSLRCASSARLYNMT